MATKYICHIWGYTDVLWKDANWLWSECQLVEEIFDFLKGLGAQLDQPAEVPWKDLKKKKRLIRLICKCKGEKYDETKEVNEDTEIDVKDIELVVRAVLNVNVDIKME